MSGIAGIIDYAHAPQQEHVRMLSAQIAHRGKDAHDLFASSTACFGYRKKQSSSEPTTMIRQGHWIFLIDTTHGEEQEIADQWEEKEMLCLPFLRGIFAFVAWNIQKEDIFLVRSADGSLPLFWTQKQQKIAICSALPPLLSLPWVENKLASEHLAEQLSFRYVHAPRTLIEHIYSVPAGHCVHINSEKQQTTRWHQPTWSASDARIGSVADISETLGTLIPKSISRAMQTNRPVGILLSGGIDSSLLLYYACTLGPPPDTFTVCLEGVPSETSFAGRVAKLMGSQNHEICISKNEFISAFDAATQAMGQPLPTAAAVVQYLLFKKLRGMVLLSGEGGDEVFGGRSLPILARHIARAKLIHKLPYALKNHAHALAKRLGHRNLAARYEEYGMDLSIGSSQVFLAPERVDVLYDTGLVRPGIRSNVLTPFYQELDSDPLNEILHVLQRGWLAEDTLARSDRMSSMFDVEVHHPLLSRDIVEFAASIPGTGKIHREGLEYVGKWPIKKLLENKIPTDLIHRPKRTMLTPLDTWLSTEGKTFLQRQIEGICDHLPHVFVRSTVRQLYEEHIRGTHNHSLKLWTLLHFYRWWLHAFEKM